MFTYSSQCWFDDDNLNEDVADRLDVTLENRMNILEKKNSSVQSQKKGSVQSQSNDQRKKSPVSDPSLAEENEKSSVLGGTRWG